MSKMSEIAMELDEQAIELGFESYEEALEKGYEVDYEKGELVNPWVLDNDRPEWCKRLESYDKELREAEEAWEKEKKGVLADLRELLNDFLPTGEQDEIKALKRAIDFVEGCRG